MIIRKPIKGPTAEGSLERAFEACNGKNVFRKVDATPKDFLEKSQYDLSRAKEDFERKDYVWAIVKGYYSIFHASNAILLLKKGYISKDHGCLYVALRKFDLIPSELFGQLEVISEALDINAFFTLMDARKTSTYDVVAWKEVEAGDARIVLDAAQAVIKIAMGVIFR